MGMVKANQQGRAESLRELAKTLAVAIDTCDDNKILPGLARQYRETIRELNEVDTPTDDGIEGIIAGIDKVR